MLTSDKVTNKATFHQNVMEILVYEEIDRQLKHYPKALASYINKVEVATYSLNRLPALYASSQQGQNQQIQTARKKYKEQVVSAVRRAIAAIERDPLRVSAPIVSETEMERDTAQKMLDSLQTLLQQRNLLDYPNQELTWDNTVGIIQRALNKMEWSNANQSLPVPPPPPLPHRNSPKTEQPQSSQQRREEIRNMGTLW
ncbi:MAG: late competence development ComFB family protein [Snowella sp.]|nr:late competence development ComFB family protein [Snowella sp.]